MKYIKILNIIAIILIFTPFVKYCSSNDEKHHTKVEQNNTLKSTEAEKNSHVRRASPENIWDKITISEKGNYITGFGLILTVVSEISRFKFENIPFSSYCMLFSLAILIFTLYKLFSGKFKRLTLYYLINIILVFIVYYEYSGRFHDSDMIKWGYYCYLSASILLFILRLIFRKRCKKNSIESILEQT